MSGNTIILQKLIFSQLITNYQRCKQPKSSLQCSQKPTICPRTKPDESSSRPSSHLSLKSFLIYSQLRRGFPSVLFPSGFRIKALYFLYFLQNVPRDPQIITLYYSVKNQQTGSLVRYGDELQIGR